MTISSTPQRRLVGFIPFRVIKTGFGEGIVIGRLPVEEERFDRPDRWEPEWRPVSEVTP